MVPTMVYDKSIVSRIKSFPQWIWAVSLVIGAALLLSGALQATRILSSLSWPTATGTIAQSDLKHGYMREGILKYKAHIVYHYDVDGTRYSGRRIAFSGAATHGWKAREVAAAYRVGDTVTVHYHPSKPGQSVLITGVTWQGFSTLLVGVVLTPLALAGLWRRWPLQTDYLFKPHDPDAPWTPARIILGGLGLLSCLAIAWIWWELIKTYAGR